MDPAVSDQIRTILDMHGTMLGKHQAQLEAISSQVESVSNVVTGLAARIQQIQLALSTPSHPASPPGQPTKEPRLPPPQTYAGDPGSCQSFLTQCQLVFALQPATFPTDGAKVAYVITLLSGRARDWGTATWSNNEGVREDFALFSSEMRKVFDRSKQGREAAREVLQLRQGCQSVSDYAIQFRTLASESGWNKDAFYDVFFNGLSEEIQDELLPHDLPKDFDELVDMAIRVGTRLSQRRRMRASSGFPLQEFRTSRNEGSPGERGSCKDLPTTSDHLTRNRFLESSSASLFSTHRLRCRGEFHRHSFGNPVESSCHQASVPSRRLCSQWKLLCQGHTPHRTGESNVVWKSL